MVLGAVVVLGCFGTAAGTLGLMAYLLEYRSKPGAGWFLASLACQALWGLTYGTALLSGDGTVRRALEIVSLAALVGVCLFFLAFALEYTGRGRIGPRWRLALLVAPVLALAVAATNSVHHLFWTGYAPAPRWGLSTVAYEVEPLALAVGTLALLAPLLGSLLLFDTVLAYGPLYRGEAAAVGLSPLAPVAAGVAWLYGLGPAGLNLAALGFLPHVVLDTYAFAASDMFEFHPATRRLGERTAVDDLPSPVVVVDDRGRVVTLNPAAESVLGVEKAPVLGRPLSEYLGADAPFDPADPGRIAVRTGGTTRTYSVSSTPLGDGTRNGVGGGRRTGADGGAEGAAPSGAQPGEVAATDGTATDGMATDGSTADGMATDGSTADGMATDGSTTGGTTEGAGNVLGYTLVWQDVTDEIRREQRLSVLNRILRHNLRNDMSLVIGTAELARSSVEDEAVADRLSAVEETARDLVALGDTAREVERVLDGDPEPRRVALEPILSEVTEAVRDRHPAASVELDAPGIDVVADPPTLSSVVEALVDNAARHAGPAPTVRVTVDRDDGAIAVRVTDDGPGIPEGELAPVRAGEETSLEHGSGLGLWLAQWGTERLGGELSFETGEDGTTATLWVPAE